MNGLAYAKICRFLVVVVLVSAAAVGAPNAASAQTNPPEPTSINADSVTRLYWATLNRAPDPGGYHYWTSAQQGGMSLEAIAESFLNSTEWQHRVGSLSSDEYVDRLYRNVLGRPADQAGRRYWLGRASAGMPRTQMLLLFSESNEFGRYVEAKNRSSRGVPWAAARGSRCQRLPRSSFDILMDPADSSTWGPQRRQGQLVLYDRFNPGETRGNFANTVGLPNLSFNRRNEIHGPRMPNGETWRLKSDRLAGAGPMGDDVAVLRGRYWFDPDTSQYRTPTQVGDRHGRVAPGRSDPLFFDGNRFDFGYLEADNLISVGPGGDTFLWSTTFKVKGWMWATDPTTFAFEVHNPVGVPGSAPVRGSIANGRLDVVGRHASNPIQTSTNTNLQTVGRTLGSWSLPPVGSFVSMVWHGRIDPGRSGFLDVWASVDGNAALRVVEAGNDWGFIFDSSSRTNGSAPSGAAGNRGFYLMSKMYDFHEWPVESQPNWDDTYGLVREGTYAGWGGSLNTGVSPQLFMEHQNALLGAMC